MWLHDSGNYRIQVFTAEGVFLRMFVRRGQGAGQLDYPINPRHRHYSSQLCVCMCACTQGLGLITVSL